MEDFGLPKGALFCLDSLRGVYIPCEFYESFNWDLSSLKKADYVELADPEHEHYDESWARLLDNFSCVLEGVEYYLYHDMDLWLVPKEGVSHDTN